MKFRFILISLFMMLFLSSCFKNHQINHDDYKTEKEFIAFSFKLSNGLAKEFQLTTTSSNKVVNATIYASPKKSLLYFNSESQLTEGLNRFFYDNGDFYIQDPQDMNTFLLLNKSNPMAKLLSFDATALIDQSKTYYQQLLQEVNENDLQKTEETLTINELIYPVYSYTFTLPLESLNQLFTADIQSKNEANLAFYAELLLKEALKNESAKNWTDSEKEAYKADLIKQAKAQNKVLVAPKITQYEITISIDQTTSRILKTREAFTQYTGNAVTDIVSEMTYLRFDKDVIFPTIDQYTIKNYE